jgi:hypothetical protein
MTAHPALREIAHPTFIPSAELLKSLSTVGGASAALTEAARDISQPLGAVAALQSMKLSIPTNLSEAFRAAMEPPPGVTEMLQQITEQYRWNAVTEAAHAITRNYNVAASVEEVFADIAGQVPDENEAPVAWSLASLPLGIQLALLMASLQLLDRAERFTATVTHTELPLALRSATDLMFAVMAFLFIWIEARSLPPDDE